MHRGAMEHPLFAGEKFTRYQAWEWLIHEASFEPHKMKHPRKNIMITVYRGQVVTTYKFLREKWQWSNDKIKSFLEILASEGMILLNLNKKTPDALPAENSSETLSETGRSFTIITICNYERYQGEQNNDRTQIGTQTERKSVHTSVHHIDKQLKQLKQTSDDDMRARAEKIFQVCEEIISSPTPFAMAPVFAWIAWGADLEMDIRPSAELWKRKNPERAMNSLAWLNEGIARSMAQRRVGMPVVPANGNGKSDDCPMTVEQVEEFLRELNA